LAGLLLWCGTAKFLEWSSVSSWFLKGLLSHHDLHHLHHWVHLRLSSSFTFVLVMTGLVCALSSKFAVWMDIDASFTVGTFGEELAFFNWVEEWAGLVGAAWVKSASHFLLSWYDRSSSGSISSILSCFSFLNLNIRLSFSILNPKS